MGFYLKWILIFDALEKLTYTYSQFVLKYTFDYREQAETLAGQGKIGLYFLAN
jgi:hypothetical protein